MSDSTNNLRHKIHSAGELQSVVRTMKSIAASSISQYQKSVLALEDYYHTIELGLGVCLRAKGISPVLEKSLISPGNREVIIIVFGSDQGLVGQFNDEIADFTIATIATKPGRQKVWAVGERVFERLSDAGLMLKGQFPVPNSVGAVAPLVAQILIETESKRHKEEEYDFYLFYNQPTVGAGYQPVSIQILALDENWESRLCSMPWHGKNLPEVIGNLTDTIRSLINEYLFVSIFRACAESLASENASRLAAMQRADKNINELLDVLTVTYHRLRQNNIDAELFDVISGFEALSKDIIGK
jgi:F-type H+-transporting ATPase subunit gamma